MNSNGKARQSAPARAERLTQALAEIAEPRTSQAFLAACQSNRSIEKANE